MPKTDALKLFIDRQSPWPTGGLAWAVLVASLLLSGPTWSAPPPQQSRPENQLLLDLLNRIERLEAEMRRLRGDLDTLQYNQENMLHRVETLEQGTAEAAAVGEAAEQAAPPRAAAQPQTPPSAAILSPALPPGAATQPNTEPRATAPGAALHAPPPAAVQPGATPTAAEQEAYTTAVNILREGHYQEAIASLQDFMAAHPGSPLGGDAQYWIGEAYYVDREYESAKQAFLSLGINYPTNRRLPDAMLRLGYIYADQGDKSKATEVLQKLVEAYPDSRAAGLARQRLESLR